MVICVVLGALLGLLVGLPSWRLSGDYLAIVTLFVYQIFISIVTNGHDLFGVDLTGGVNGIANLDPFDLFGIEIVVVEGRDLQLELRICRARRLPGRVRGALPRKPLPHRARLARAARGHSRRRAHGDADGLAEAARVRLRRGGRRADGLALRFAQGRRLPRDLLADAAHHRLRDADSGRRRKPTGAVLGAVVVYVFLEALRDPDVSGWVFYLAALLALVLVVRPRWMVAVVLAATAVFGFAVHAVAGAIDESWTTSAQPEADTVTRFLDAWVVIPVAPGDSRTLAYIGLVALILLATTVKGSGAGQSSCRRSTSRPSSGRT